MIKAGISPLLEEQARTIRQLLDSADRVLIGAGAGLSADAGVDYTDEVRFARQFPALVKRGIRAAYQMIGRHTLPPAVFWGYWLLHVDDVRFGDGARPVYQHLFDLVGRKDWLGRRAWCYRAQTYRAFGTAAKIGAKRDARIEIPFSRQINKHLRRCPHSKESEPSYPFAGDAS